MTIETAYGRLGLNGSCTGGSSARNQIGAEAGDTAGTQASLNDTNLRTLAGKSSGIIRFSDFYGKSSVTYTPQLRVGPTCASGTFTVPSCTPSCTTYYYGLIGGGGAGFGTLYVAGTPGQASSLAHGYGGGGGGQFVYQSMRVNAGDVIHWCIGAGGVATPGRSGGGGGAGTDGGASRIWKNACLCITTASGGAHGTQRFGGCGGGYVCNAGGYGTNVATNPTAAGGGGGACATSLGHGGCASQYGCANSLFGKDARAGNGGSGVTHSIGGGYTFTAGGGGGGGYANVVVCTGVPVYNGQGGVGGGGCGGAALLCEGCPTYMGATGTAGLNIHGGGGGGAAVAAYRDGALSTFQGGNGGRGGVIIWG